MGCRQTLSRFVGSIIFPAIEPGLQHDDVVTSCDTQSECCLSRQAAGVAEQDDFLVIRDVVDTTQNLAPFDIASAWDRTLGRIGRHRAYQ